MAETFGLDLDQARAYEETFVPALFAQWAEPLVSCGRVHAGHRVLDVACGTGSVARTAAAVAGPTGHVAGIDLAPAMIKVAEEVAPALHWHVGDAEHLPFDGGSFDVVLCQSALFFFEHPHVAVAEMARVLSPRGVVALQTYAGLDEQPGYGPFVDLVLRHAGPQARSLLDTYWSQGDLLGLTQLLEGADLRVLETRSLLGEVTFPSVEALLNVEIRGTPLAQRIDEATYAAIETEAPRVLAEFLAPTGSVTLPIRARFVAATKPAPD